MDRLERPQRLSGSRWGAPSSSASCSTSCSTSCGASQCQRVPSRACGRLEGSQAPSPQPSSTGERSGRSTRRPKRWWPPRPGPRRRRPSRRASGWVGRPARGLSRGGSPHGAGRHPEAVRLPGCGRPQRDGPPPYGVPDRPPSVLAGWGVPPMAGGAAPGVAAEAPGEACRWPRGRVARRSPSPLGRAGRESPAAARPHARLPSAPLPRTCSPNSVFHSPVA